MIKFLQNKGLGILFASQTLFQHPLKDYTLVELEGTSKKGGAPCSHFENGKCTLPFWTPESDTLFFSEHLKLKNS